MKIKSILFILCFFIVSFMCIGCSTDGSDSTANENLITNTNGPQIEQTTKKFNLRNVETQKSFGRCTVNATKADRMTSEVLTAYAELESYVLQNRNLTQTWKDGCTEYIGSSDGGYDPNQDLVWYVVYTYYKNNSGFGYVGPQDGYTYLFIIRRK